MAERRPKIAYVANLDYFVRFILLDHLKALKREGFDVYAVCPDGQWVRDIRAKGIPVKTIRIRRKISPLSDLWALCHLVLYFWRSDFDIVHTHTPKAGLLGQVAARLVRVPIVVSTIHGFYFYNMRGMKRKFFVYVDKLCALCSDLIFFVNREDPQIARREGICPKDKICFLQGGIGVDLERYNPDRYRDSNGLYRAELGLRKDSFTIGMVARLTYEKGVLEFFEAAARVARLGEDVQLVVVGPEDGIEERRLRGLADTLGIGRSVVFLGARTDMPEIYTAVDVVVLPSHREGLGLSLVEASAMQRPVIATDTRGCRDAVVHGHTGLLVPVKNPDALADAILQIIRSPEEARRMGQAGRRRVEELFDQRKILKTLTHVYTGLIDRRSAEAEIRNRRLRGNQSHSF